MTDFKDTLASLSAPFHPSEVKQRQGGGRMLDYVDWTSVVRRLNGACPDWSMTSNISNFMQVPNKKGETAFVAVVEVAVTVDGVTRTGVGADHDTDPDKVVKTAQAEGFKKANNQFGVSLDLWDKEHRDMVAAYRSEDIVTLKAKVAALVPDLDKAKDKVAAIRKHFTLADDVDLNDPDVLVGLINR